MNVVRSAEPAEGESRLRAITPGDPGGVFRRFSLLLDWTPKRRIEADHAHLKRMLELRSPWLARGFVILIRVEPRGRDLF